VKAQVAAHFASKQPPPKEVIASKVVAHFVDLLERPRAHVENLKTDYDHAISNSYIEIQQTRSGRTVPQLGELEK
jgi:hypothetical protein